MGHSKKYCLLMVLLVCSLWIQAQDKIYYNKSKVDDWKVTEISPGYVKGIDVKNPEITYSTNRENILFIFNKAGNFLVIPNLYESETNSEVYIRNFLKLANDAFHKADRIFTANNMVITCQVEMDNDQGIAYSMENKKHTISRSEVVLVIFKDGHHKLFADVNKTYKVLKAIQKKYNEVAFSTLKVPEVNIVPSRDTVVQSSDTQKVKVHQPSLNHAGEKDLDPVTLASLKEKALFNIKELESYIKIISDKHANLERSTKAVDQALALFASENSMIEVSSMNRSEAMQYKVRVYLNRLSLVKYSKVIIEWSNVQYASKVRKNPDGTYAGIIEFEQLFTGLSGDKKQYKDITRKTIEVILKPYIKRSGGEEMMQWEVLLGNIGVSVTKPE